jgi:RecA-family ATPase
LNDACPDGFGSWPVEDRNAFFAKAAQEYDKRKAPERATREAQPDHPLVSASRSAEAPQTVVELPVMSASIFTDEPVPERLWIVLNMIPDRTVTIVGGDGAVGKSTLMLQLAVAMVGGAPWIGTNPAQGPVAVVSAEDDIDELHRRVVAVARGLGVKLADLTGLHLIPLAGKDAVMAAPKGRTNLVRETPVWRGLVAVVEHFNSRLVIIDTRADVFAGNENDRAQARQFSGLLRGLAIARNLGVVLIEHPSLVGLTSRTGTSGSTGWNNAVRSRLYLENVRDDAEIGRDLRVLRVMKANYGPAGQELQLRWADGCFILDGPTGGFENLIVEAKADRVFLELLASHNAQGRDVSDSPGSNYAPAVFAGAAPERLTKDVLRRAMNRLFVAGRVLADIGVDDFENPRLEAVRLRMTRQDLQAVSARLHAEAHATFEEAEQLKRFGQKRFGANDNLT